MVDVLLPLSTQPSKESRYTVSDPHLRFRLAFIGPFQPELDRGRGDLLLRRIRAGWTGWRGRAVEAVVRESLLRAADGILPEATGAVGGYWTRTNDVEIGIVAADREPVAKGITAVGSIKWLERRPFDAHDLAELIVHRSRMPGADSSTQLIAVSRSGVSVGGVRAIGPEDLLSAWRARGPAA